MQLEVPADQYAAAVEATERRIAKGEVPNVTDPSQAEELARKGYFTYRQAQKTAQWLHVLEREDKTGVKSSCRDLTTEETVTQERGCSCVTVIFLLPF